VSLRQREREEWSEKRGREGREEKRRGGERGGRAEGE
jgi:hypothetical protein